MTAPAASMTEEEQRDSDLRKFLKSWTWKREHRPDRDRFQRPYTHTLTQGEPLVIKQAKFSAAGFASTVWDSSIVLARYLEAHPSLVEGRTCLDLSAGCGLVGLVAARLGAARVVATDLEPNLPLLMTNCQTNAPGLVDVQAHTWGEDVQHLGPPFDIIFAADLMYIREAVPSLLASLQALCAPGPGSEGDHSGSAGVPSQVILAHGRNRFAEEAFMEQALPAWSVRVVTEGELHPDYQCSDVAVYSLTRKGL